MTLGNQKQIILIFSKFCQTRNTHKIKLQLNDYIKNGKFLYLKNLSTFIKLINREKKKIIKSHEVCDVRNNNKNMEWEERWWSFNW